jgi:hypothetical protein
VVVIMVSHGAKHSRNILSMSRRRNCYHLADGTGREVPTWLIL